MKKIGLLLLLALCVGGCHDNVSELICQHNGGIKSWHAHGNQLEVTCDDGTIFNIDWL